MPRVSIIIPLYNKAQYVERSLSSVIAQSFQDWDLTVVDDGSTDGGESLVRACKDPRVRIFTQDNSGPGAARNAGLAQASGEYVAFLDADDEWEPTYLESCLDEFEKYGVDVGCVSTGYWVYPRGWSTEPTWRRMGVRDGLWRVDQDTSALLLAHYLELLVPWNTVSRRTILLKHGGFFDRYKCLYAEDAYLWLKVLLNETVCIRLRPLVRFHSDASGLSRNLSGPRPIEPFFTDADGIYKSCPPTLYPLLREILALRAVRTACMLGYWGRWREARNLLTEFASGVPIRAPRYTAARLLASPAGAVVSAVLRRFVPVSMFSDGL